MTPTARIWTRVAAVSVAGWMVTGAGVPTHLDAQQASEPVVVASKPFAESFLLGEMFAQLLESEGFVVDRRPGLGATEIAFQALRTGAIDVYPEYTGTGLLAVLSETPRGDAREVFRRVSTEFARRWDVRWLPPLGFENTYAIAVRPETADSLGLRTLSDLAARGSDLIGGFTPDFIGRDDGLPGLVGAYGLALDDVRSLLQAVKYDALVQGSVDVIDGYGTDGQLARYDLRVLDDDRAFFPPYEAAALVGSELYRDRPDVIAALTRLSGRLDEAQVQRWNERLEGGAEPVEDVAQAALQELGLLAAAEGAAEDQASGAADSTTLPSYLWTRRGELGRLTVRHMTLVLVSLLAAMAVAIPLGLGLERRPDVGRTVVRAVGLLQTIPGIALLAFMIPLFGIGVGPALVALFLYSLLPILQNTFTGVVEADPSAVEAAEALGMTRSQVARWVRLPLAAPVILAGVRTAAVISVGTATLAAFIGAGGLGDPIVAGLALSDTRMILSGAIPAAALAFLVDAALAGVERWVAPQGLRAE